MSDHRTSGLSYVVPNVFFEKIYRNRLVAKRIKVLSDNAICYKHNIAKYIMVNIKND